MVNADYATERAYLSGVEALGAGASKAAVAASMPKVTPKGGGEPRDCIASDLQRINPRMVDDLRFVTWNGTALKLTVRSCARGEQQAFRETDFLATQHAGRVALNMPEEAYPEHRNAFAKAIKAEKQAAASVRRREPVFSLASNPVHALASGLCTPLAKPVTAASPAAFRRASAIFCHPGAGARAPAQQHARYGRAADALLRREKVWELSGK
jgi:hypothetical protein